MSSLTAAFLGLSILGTIAATLFVIVQAIKFLQCHLVVKKASALFEQLQEWRPNLDSKDDLGFHHCRGIFQKLDSLFYGNRYVLLARHNLTVDVIHLVYDEQQKQFMEACSKIIRSGDGRMEHLLIILKDYWEKTPYPPSKDAWGQNQWDKWRMEGLSNRVKKCIECEIKKLIKISGFSRKDNQPFLCAEDLDSLATTLHEVADQVEGLKPPVFVTGMTTQSANSENKDVPDEVPLGNLLKEEFPIKTTVIPEE